MNKYLKLFIKYFCAISVGVGIFFLVTATRGMFSLTDKKEIFRYLADGFTIPAALFLGAGLLVFLANEGALDGLVYVVKHAVLMLIPLVKNKHESYGDFKERRKALHGFSFLFVTSGIFWIPTIVFLILYSNM